MKENLAKYEALRNSIVSCEERMKNEMVNMYVVYFAAAAFALESEKNWILIIAQLVLIIFQVMINDDRINIEKISTYIRVFFEEHGDDMHWESMHKNQCFIEADRKRRNIGWYLYRWGSTVFSFVTLIALMLDFFTNGIRNEVKEISLLALMQIVIGIILFIITISVNRQFYTNKVKDNNPIDSGVIAYYSICFREVLNKNVVK